MHEVEKELLSDLGQQDLGSLFHMWILSNC
jgi:hypothetical protein